MGRQITRAGCTVRVLTEGAVGFTGRSREPISRKQIGLTGREHRWI
jgi:hypothetical protein